MGSRQIKVSLNSIEKAKGFCTKCIEYAHDVDMLSGRYIIDGKSILGIFSLDLTKDITCTVYGSEEETGRFVESVKELVTESAEHTSSTDNQ